MRQNGRKSAAALAIAAPVASSVRRMPAPVHLSDAERAVWIQCVEDSPADAFTPVHQPMLEAYCRHVVRGQILAGEIEAFDRAWLSDGDGLDRYDKLLKMAERESRAASSLATRMRITRHSQYDKSHAMRAVNRMTRSKKPWELPENAEQN